MALMLEILVGSIGYAFIYHVYGTLQFTGFFTTFIKAFLTLFVSVRVWNTFITPAFFSPLSHVPNAPGGTFLFGHTGRVLKDPAGKPQRDWTENVPNDGLIRYSMWWKERLLITTPKALGEVLVSKNYDFVKPSQFRNGLGRLLGIGILLAEGEEHKIQRKNLMPAFHFRHIKDLYPTFWSKSKELTECLSKAIKSAEAPSDEENSVADDERVPGDEPQHQRGSIEVGNWSSRATLDIIGLCGLGQDFNAMRDQDNKLNLTYRSLFKPPRNAGFWNIIGVFVPFSILSRLPVARNAEVNSATGYIKQVCRDLIASKRKKLEAGDRSDVDILSVAIESGGFTDDDLVNQLMTFLVAGHETTATAMIWALYVLCKNPEIQKKLREEIRSKLPSPEESITPADLDNCHYLKAVCLEVLRLWAPVSMTMRVAALDTSINGQEVPKDTTIILSPWAINTSKHLWGADAMEFKPERWLNPDGKANNRGSSDSAYSFLTFLHGPRSCIGQKFAEAEFECLLAAWVGRFETSFEEGSPLIDGDPEIRGGITAKPKGGLWVQLKEVEGW